jgi:hypothetical protein
VSQLPLGFLGIEPFHQAKKKRRVFSMLEVHCRQFRLQTLGIAARIVSVALVRMMTQGIYFWTFAVENIGETIKRNTYQQ